MIHHPRRFQVHSSNRNLLSTVYTSRRYIGFLSYSLPSAKIHWSVVFYILLCRWFRFAQLAKGKKFRP
jgi:hypothetical protein